MKKFIQLHTLTAYPLGNPNRDDQGRPKSAIIGGVPRLRISSQSYKRAIRVSDLFAGAFDGQIGMRSRRIGELLAKKLIENGHEPASAINAATIVSGVFGKNDALTKKGGLKSLSVGAKNTTVSDEALASTAIAQMAFASPAEIAAAEAVAAAIAIDGQFDPKKMKDTVLRRADGAVDLALFGRMLAHSPDYNRQAALQVAHLTTTHQASAQEDFFTAVEDLNMGRDHGAGHIGYDAFGGGVFYGYFCLDVELLCANLDGDVELAKHVAETLVRAVATVTPDGKKSSYGHQTMASMLMLEMGNQQPRSLAQAFLKPVAGHDILGASIASLRSQAEIFDKFYGACADHRGVLDITDAQSLDLESLAGSVQVAF